MATDPDPPSLGGVLETVLYFTDAAATEAFYSGVLGMRLLNKDQHGRQLFYRAGRSVFLLFDARASSTGQTLPAHGSSGAGHACFQVTDKDFGLWRNHLAGAGVEIVQEVSWQRGKSFYFRDPSGNLLEIADGDIWPG
ncbi:MAG: VOC family protein [Actinomycetota bacterium]